MTVQRGNATSLGPLRKLEDFFDVTSPREERINDLKSYNLSKKNLFACIKQARGNISYL